MNLALTLFGRETSLRCQPLPLGAGSKLACPDATPIGLDLGDISQVSMLAMTLEDTDNLPGWKCACVMRYQGPEQRSPRVPVLVAESNTVRVRDPYQRRPYTLQ
jgi:hypothetical protein